MGALRSKNTLDLWTDRRIKAFQDWRAEIDKAMSGADMAILMVTANFLSSEFIQSQEVPELLERHKNDAQLTIYPILAKECAWQLVPWLEARQMRPNDGKAVWRDGGRHVDRELTTIVLEIDASLQLTRQAKEEAAKGLLAKAQASLAKLSTVGEILADNRNLVLTQLQLDAQKQQKERRKILEDTQAKIFAIQQDVTANRKATRDDAYKKWDEFLKA